MFTLGAGCNTSSNVSTTNSANIIVANTNTTNTVVAQNDNNNVNEGSDSAVDTSDWPIYTNEEYGFSFRYPDSWQIETVKEGGLGKDIGDIQLSKDKCFIHIDKPTQASDDIMTAFITGELGGLSLEVLRINGVDALKQVGAVNTYGDIGTSYRILNNNKEVSLIVMQSGLDVESCVEDYSIMVNSITKF